MVKHTSVLKMLPDRFSRARIIPGTRSFHQFIPLFRGEIATKRVSEDIDYSLKFEFEQVQQVLLFMVSIDQFVLCTCGSHKRVGMAWEVNTTHNNIEMKFMHLICPSKSYTWSRRDDICWVPKTNILFQLKTPSWLQEQGDSTIYIMTIKNISKIYQFNKFL